MTLGWWPGPQVGACALYRRREFVAEELCGCESGKLYHQCHQFLDNQMSEDAARRQFRRLFASEYEDRQAPHSVQLAAESRWKRMPEMASIFIRR